MIIVGDKVTVNGFVKVTNGHAVLADPEDVFEVVLRDDTHENVWLLRDEVTKVNFMAYEDSMKKVKVQRRVWVEKRELYHDSSWALCTKKEHYLEGEFVEFLEVLK